MTEPRKTSHGKAILTTAILDGTVTDGSDPNTVYESCIAYQQYDRNKFKMNLKNLILALKKKEDRALFDAQAIDHDRQLFPRAALTNRGYPFWDTSAAKELLASDINEGKHLTMTSRDLWQSREAYLLFPLAVFQQHIGQEKKKQSQSLYWNVIEARHTDT
jgi:hypothetical protein